MGIIVDDAARLNINSRDICEFYKKHWNNKTVLSTIPFYKWQFTESPADAGKDHCMVAVDEESKKILGVMGLNTRPFYLASKTVKGAELTTWIIDKNFQGQGIGTQILKKIQKKYDILIGMGITDMALPVYMTNGFRYIKAIPRFIKVFNLDAIAAYAKFDPIAIKLINDWSTKGVNIPFKVNSIRKMKIKPLEDIARKNLNYFCRDYNYLQWRYSQHPVFNYKQFIVSSTNNSKGVFVCLREEASVKNLKILHVLDFFGDQKDMPAAISFICDYCKKNNFHLVDFYCTATKVSRHFINSGWFSINDDSCFQFPHLFHPLELRVPPTTSLIYWSKTNFAGLADTASLYITKEDCDFDRPTMHTYQLLQNKRL